ncbi:MAG: hypothetical protein JWM11_7412 [Planctomycetaceae bacterium]|nr:hypothetical protein [Planctomycetaceae bacterium]
MNFLDENNPIATPIQFGSVNPNRSSSSSYAPALNSLPGLQMTRRGLLRMGAVALGGGVLADLLKHEAEAAGSSVTEKRSVILLMQKGGPSQLDMWDMKPDAPVEYRGEFSSIASNIPGYRVCELMPKLSQMCDRLAILRTVYHTMMDHGEGMHIAMTGYAPIRNIKASGQQAPSLGSIVSKELGWRAGLPGYIAVQREIGFGRSAYLGIAHDPFETFGYPTSDGFRVRNLRASDGVNSARESNRRTMLEKFDTLRRDADTSGAIGAMDTYRRQAFELATSPQVQEAFDLGKEDPKVRDRYGRKSNAGQSMLLARRLVERGARFVTVATDYDRPWDSHDDNFTAHRQNIQGYDHTVSALLEDLEARGLLEQTLVIIGGEFGRTPRINAKAGRDHWPTCYTTVMVGGGIKRGVILGTSDSLGELPKERPISIQDVYATMYHQLGIDYTKSYLNEANRPVQIVNYGEPIQEIL